MKIAEAGKIEMATQYPSMEYLSELLDRERNYDIDTINWNDYNYRPDVKFSIAWSDHELFLKYYVAENCFRAQWTESNQNVYEDSCVEFFVSPGDDDIYYNFEFNGIGTCLLGSGHSRTDSRRADPAIISSVRRLASAGNKPVNEIKGEFRWTLVIAIPFGVFFHHKTGNLKGKRFRANFYKCGDKLSIPHFVTWNPVKTEKPDFHRPEYFGELRFI